MEGRGVVRAVALVAVIVALASAQAAVTTDRVEEEAGTATQELQSLLSNGPGDGTGPTGGSGGSNGSGQGYGGSNGPGQGGYLPVPPDPLATPRSAADRAERLADRIANAAPDVVQLTDDLRHQAEDIPRQIDVPDILAPEGAKAEGGGPNEVQSQGAVMLSQPLAQAIVVATVAGATAIAVWLAAGSSGSVGASAAAKGATDLRRLLPYASPLFTRFERDTVLGHPRREALYALILQTPGISLQALGDATSLSRTATLHHLRLMEKQHLIVSRRMGRSRHFFENGGRFRHDQKEAYAVLQNERSRDVAMFIQAHPGSHQKDLCEALGIPPSIAHWHVRRLQEALLVDVRREGRNVAYLPGAGLEQVTQPATPAATAPVGIAA